MKISIIYWSGTGNTEEMANLINKGATQSGDDVSLKPVSDATPDDVAQADVVALGCPSMGVEVLEENEFESFNDSILDKVSGKKIALFGSYGWGDGEWMRNWEEQLKNAGAFIIDTLIVNEKPEGDDAEKCVQLGKDMAKEKK